MEEVTLVSSVNEELLENALEKMMRQAKISDLKLFLEMINSGNLEVSEYKKWTEKNGVIYFSIIAKSSTIPELIKRIEDKGMRVSDRIKINTGKIKVESKTYNIAVIIGNFIDESDRTNDSIISLAKELGLLTPKKDDAMIMALLIRDWLSDDEFKKLQLNSILVMGENSVYYPGPGSGYVYFFPQARSKCVTSEQCHVEGFTSRFEGGLSLYHSLGFAFLVP